jgi:hypothetical protein
MISCLLRSMLFVFVFGGCVWMAHRADMDRRAPVILTNASFCEVSPSGGYLSVLRAQTPEVRFVRTDTHIVSTIPVPPDANMVWLDDATFFYYTTSERSISQQTYDTIPTNGWVVDMPTQMVQDINTLPPTVRQQLLQLATRERNNPETNLSVGISPNGFLWFVDDGHRWVSIRERANLASKLTEFWNLRLLYGCIPGWRAANDGFYFIEFTSTFEGTLRLLLTNPPPPYLPIAWLAVGLLGSTAIWRAQQLYAILRKQLNR